MGNKKMAEMRNRTTRVKRHICHKRRRSKAQLAQARHLGCQTYRKGPVVAPAPAIVDALEAPALVDAPVATSQIQARGHWHTTTVKVEIHDSHKAHEAINRSDSSHEAGNDKRSDEPPQEGPRSSKRVIRQKIDEEYLYEDSLNFLSKARSVGEVQHHRITSSDIIIPAILDNFQENEDFLSDTSRGRARHRYPAHEAKVQSEAHMAQAHIAAPSAQGHVTTSVAQAHITASVALALGDSPKDPAIVDALEAPALVDAPMAPSQIQARGRRRTTPVDKEIHYEPVKVEIHDAHEAINRPDSSHEAGDDEWSRETQLEEDLFFGSGDPPQDSGPSPWNSNVSSGWLICALSSLNKVCRHLGFLGPALRGTIEQALDVGTNAITILRVFQDTETQGMLDLVDIKLGTLEKKAKEPQSQKMFATARKNVLKLKNPNGYDELSN